MSDDAPAPLAESERTPAGPTTFTQTSAPLGQLDGLDVHGARRRTRIRALAALAAVAVAVVAIVLATNLNGSGKSGGGVGDNGTPISYATVEEGSLSQQTQVSATLGYTGSASILVPSGTAPAALQQAKQAVTSAEGQAASASTTLASDVQSLEALQASIAATKAKVAIDCAGDTVATVANAADAAESPSSGSGSPANEKGSPGGDSSSPGGSSSNPGGNSGSPGGSSSNPGGNSGSPGGSSNPSSGSGSTCSSDQQALASDEQSLPQDKVKVEGDRTQLASAQSSLAGARSTYAQSRASATSYAQGAAYTALPSVGAIVHRNQRVFAIAGQPTVLLYGGTPATRAFILGMSAGGDVGELNSNLEALGYGHSLGGDDFTAASAAAIRVFQSAHGMSATGELLLGSVLFWYGPMRVTRVTPTLGSAVNPGPALAVSGTGRQVTIQLDASQQGSLKAGDQVTITLPTNETTPGIVSSVGTVATTPPSSGGHGGEESSPTIEVTVRPTNPAATGHLDQAPVEVAITTASVENVLSVPVTALLALAGGGYAVEVVAANGAHHLEAVSTGMFDGATGRVQVSGPEVAVGQRVVVPASS